MRQVYVFELACKPNTDQAWCRLQMVHVFSFIFCWSMIWQTTASSRVCAGGFTSWARHAPRRGDGRGAAQLGRDPACDPELQHLPPAAGERCWRAQLAVRRRVPTEHGALLTAESKCSAEASIEKTRFQEIIFDPRECF
jgi:hypothetical protein